MKFIIGKDRNQTEFFCLEEAISTNNEVRLIDLFASANNLADHGFDMKFLDNGRPAYLPADLLKLFIYGYLNRIRSSRLDLYLCPAGQQLQTNGRWYLKKHGKTTNRMKHYKTSACKACSFFERCTKNKAGRLIELTEHAELIEANKQRIELNKEQLCQI